jgi:hypothetical protein
MPTKRKSNKKVVKIRKNNNKNAKSTVGGSTFVKKSAEVGKRAIAAVGTGGNKTTKRKKAVKKKQLPKKGKK